MMQHLLLLSLLLAYHLCLPAYASFLHSAPLPAAAIYSALPIAPLPALTYGAAPPPATALFKYATAVAAAYDVPAASTVRYAYGTPVTTTTTTYAGFATPHPISGAAVAAASAPVFARFAAYGVPQAPPLPNVYAAAHQPLPYARFGYHAPQPAAVATYGAW